MVCLIIPVRRIDQGVQGKAGGDQKLRENIDSSEVIDLRVEFFSLGWVIVYSGSCWYDRVPAIRGDGTAVRVYSAGRGTPAIQHESPVNMGISPQWIPAFEWLA